MLTDESVEFIEDRDVLGQRIMQSAVSQEFGSFAVKCRSVTHATDFSTPMRGMLLTLSSAFGGMSATISPSLNLHTWPAMGHVGRRAGKFRCRRAVATDWGTQRRHRRGASRFR